MNIFFRQNIKFRDIFIYLFILIILKLEHNLFSEKNQNISFVLFFPQFSPFTSEKSTPLLKVEYLVFFFYLYFKKIKFIIFFLYFPKKKLKIELLKVSLKI